jgi:hypothetical protein
MHQHEHEWVIMKHDGTYALWRCLFHDDSGREHYTVTMVDFDRGQVYSALPGDKPHGGGRWVARMTSAGVSYVASARSKAYAMRHYRRLKREYAEAINDE